tara:strand:- start:147 stop:449 length:303 start_codon:yes stop_codon:yes gene_type:complete
MKKLTIEEVNDKIDELEFDINTKLEKINERLDVQEDVLRSFNETLDKIEGYLNETLSPELEDIEEEFVKVYNNIDLVREEIQEVDERANSVTDDTRLMED